MRASQYRLLALPEREVQGILLAIGALEVLALVHLLDVAARERPVAGQRPHRFFVRFEEQTILAAEMLEHGALCDPQFIGHIADSRFLKSALGEVPHCNINDLRTLHGRAGARLIDTVWDGR